MTGRWTTAGLAALALATAGAASAQTIPGSNAPDEPLGVLSAGDGLGRFLGQSRPTTEGRFEIWTWVFTDLPQQGVTSFTFHNEIDCPSRTFRRLAREIIEANGEVKRYGGDSDFREPTPIEGEGEIIRIVCDGPFTFERVLSPRAAFERVDQSRP